MEGKKKSRLTEGARCCISSSGCCKKKKKFVGVVVCRADGKTGRKMKGRRGDLYRLVSTN